MFLKVSEPPDRLSCDVCKNADSWPPIKTPRGPEICIIASNSPPQNSSRCSEVMEPLFQGFAFNGERSCLYEHMPQNRTFIHPQDARQRSFSYCCFPPYSLETLHTSQVCSSLSPHDQAHGHVSDALQNSVGLPQQQKQSTMTKLGCKTSVVYHKQDKRHSVHFHLPRG